MLKFFFQFEIICKVFLPLRDFLNPFDGVSTHCNAHHKHPCGYQTVDPQPISNFFQDFQKLR